MSIPGTHNSYALYDGASLGFAQCQEWDVPKQLRNGIRFLDVRFRRLGDKFGLYHGSKFQHKYGRDAFNEITDFLDEYPTETILVSYQEEHNPYSGSSSFQSILNSYLTRFSRWTYGKNEGEDATVIPRLQDVRGKMVFIDNKSHGNFGLPWHKLSKADNYDNPTQADKIRGVKTHLEAARRSSGSKLFLTYCSYTAARGGLLSNYQTARGYGGGGCSSTYCTDRHWSPGMTIMVGFDLMDMPKASYGVVIMDYPTMGAIGATLQHNPGLAKACAIVENSDRDMGSFLVDEQQKTLGGNWWNDKIAYAVQPKDCYLKVWQDYRYEGNVARLHRPGSTHSSRDNAHETIWYNGHLGSWAYYVSSYKCYC